MKKFLFMALLALVMVACGNDDEPEKASATLNVSELVGYVGKTADYVKANIKGATLLTEGGSLGKTTLTYTLPTEDVSLSVTFKSNASGEITNVDVYGKYDGYDKGIECFKKEMDKIKATQRHAPIPTPRKTVVCNRFSQRYGLRQGGCSCTPQ